MERVFANPVQEGVGFQGNLSVWQILLSNGFPTFLSIGFGEGWLQDLNCGGRNGWAGSTMNRDKLPDDASIK